MARDEICQFFGIELHDRNGSLFENRKSAKSLYPTTHAHVTLTNPYKYLPELAFGPLLGI